VEDGALENLEHVRAEVEGHEFGEAEGDGDVAFKDVDWESRRLQGLLIPVQSPRVKEV